MEYMTSDSRLAAFLVARGQPVQRVEGPGYRRTFVFSNVADLATAFYSGRELIEPQAFCEGMRQVKKLLFTQQPA